MSLTKKISITITDELVLNKAVDEKNYRKTIYGLEILLSVLIQTIGLVLFGMFIGILDKMIPVAFSFALLRAFAGGYHADTCFECFIMTLAMCAGGIVLAEYAATSIAGLIAMLAASLLLVAVLAPKDTVHKRMTAEGKSINRNRSIMVLVGLSAIALGLYAFSPICKLYPALVISGLFLESLSLLIKTN
jgi:accessory gene regulator B